jgi:sodium transport system permease protein
MNWRKIFTVYRKELKDMLRDRRTIFSMVLVPALIMPGLMLMAGGVAVTVVKRARQEVPKIMIVGGEDSPGLRQVLQTDPRLKVVPAETDYARQISEKTIRAAVEIPPGFEHSLEAGEKAAVRIYTYSGELKSGLATAEIDRKLREFRENFLRRKLAERNLPDSYIQPFGIEQQNVAPPEKVGGNAVGGVIPYVFIILCFTGAMYPAIDLSAGEKERGTLETVLCSPVGRGELVTGKFLMILTASLGTVVCSLASLGLTAAVAGIGFSSGATATALKGAAAAHASGASAFALSPVGLVAVFVLVIPLAVLFSAGLFAVALCAKSHKEAQTYVAPLVAVTILPAVAGVLPGVELTPKLAFVPILNVALASKEMVSGNFPLGLIAIIFLSSCVYAGGALALAANLFNRESVLFRT